MKPVNVLVTFCVCVLATKAAQGCFPADNADYNEWLSVGQPPSWCYPRQCHGDVDGKSTAPPLPNFPVYTNDLSILLNSWKKPWSMDPCLGADIDHRATCSPFAGCWRVGPRDLCIMQQFFGLPVAFVPADCQGPGAIPSGTVEPMLSLRVDTGSGFYDPGDPIIVDVHSTVKIGIVNNTTDLATWYDAHVVIYGPSSGAWTGNNWVYTTNITVPGWTYYGRDIIPEMDAWFVQVSGIPTLTSDYGPPAGSVSAWVEFSPVADEYTQIYLLDDQCDEILDVIDIFGQSQIYLLCPNGGESIKAGGEYLIEWSGSGDINNVFIEYSNNNGTSWNPIVLSTINDGAYEWNPVADANSNQCLLRISDAANPSTNDASDELFTIFQCTHSIVGDLNGDCYVDFLDFAILGNHWLECGNPFDNNCN